MATRETARPLRRYGWARGRAVPLPSRPTPRPGTRPRLSVQRRFQRKRCFAPTLLKAAGWATG